tara:strand:- start:184 stop:630 length:447 start_codon:yes stop_codon:yes gene_type:complete
MDTFKKDIVIGEDAENVLLDIIKQKYPKAEKIKGQFIFYDIYVPEIDVKIEVKRDIGSNKSKNFFLEYTCNGVDSGLNASLSDYYAICDESNFIWIKTPILKEVAKKYGRYWKDTPKGGASVVEAYLTPKKYVFEYADYITKLPESLH